MDCCHHYYDVTGGNADAFTVSMPRLTFGRGTLGEVGARARALGMRRVALMTDACLAQSEHLARARDALRCAGVGFTQYAEVRIEPTDRSVLEAVAFLKSEPFDGAVSVGGGSMLVIFPFGVVVSIGLDDAAESAAIEPWRRHVGDPIAEPESESKPGRS